MTALFQIRTRFFKKVSDLNSVKIWRHNLYYIAVYVMVVVVVLVERWRSQMLRCFQRDLPKIGLKWPTHSSLIALSWAAIPDKGQAITQFSAIAKSLEILWEWVKTGNYTSCFHIAWRSSKRRFRWVLPFRRILGRYASCRFVLSSGVCQDEV